MVDCESIDDMLIDLSFFTSRLVSLCKPIFNDQKVWKIIRALPRSWEVKAITLEELNDKEEMKFIWFVRNLKTYKMEIKAREEHELPKKTNVSLKASQSKFKNKEDSDEELFMLVKKIGQMFYNQRMKNKRKAMKATIWDSDSESEREDDSAHMWFMVQGPPRGKLKISSRFWWSKYR